MAGSHGGAIFGLPSAKDAMEAAGKRLARWAERFSGGPARFQIIFVLLERAGAGCGR